MTSTLGDMRKSLRRNRRGMHYDPFRENVSSFTTRPSSMKYRSGLVGSDSSSSSAKGNLSKSSIDRSLGIAERLVKFRRASENEGIDSLRSSLAGTRRHRMRREPRYSQVLQEDDASEYSEYSENTTSGLIYATKSMLINMMKCLLILFAVACIAVFFSIEREAKISISAGKKYEHSGYDHVPFDPISSVLTKQRLDRLDSIANLTTAYDPRTEIPMFLDVRLTGATMVKRAMSKCFNLTLACDLGLRQPNFDEKKLSVFSSEFMGFTGFYVNVDTSTTKGIHRATRLGLASSGLAEVVSTPFLQEGNDIFRSSNGTHARLFAMFAHPIARSIGHYYYIQHATWDRDYNAKVKKMTLFEYSASPYLEDNPFVRLLAGKKWPSPLTPLDLEIAKKIIETKVLVGLYRDLGGSLSRFQRYFGWGEERGDMIGCKSQMTITGEKWMKMHKDKLASDEPVYTNLLRSKKLDMDLYQHVEMLYTVQGEKIFDVV